MSNTTRSTRLTKRQREAASKMYDALMYLMHHPSECSQAAWLKARQALEAAGMDFEEDVREAREARLRDSALRMQAANLQPGSPPDGTVSVVRD